MDKGEFFYAVYPRALAVTLSPQKALFATIQAANESGYISSNSIASQTDNLFGIICSDFNRQGYKDCYRGFRTYNNFSESIRDWKKLLQTAYPKAYNANSVTEFATNIAYSPYITDEDGRERYKNNLIAIHRDLAQYQSRFWLYVILALIAICVLAYFVVKNYA